MKKLALLALILGMPASNAAESLPVTFLEFVDKLEAEIQLPDVMAIPNAIEMPIFEAFDIVLDDPNNRRLQSVCSQITPQFEDILRQVYGVRNSCNCQSIGSNRYRVSCSTSKELCCGETCGHIRTSMKFRLGYSAVYPEEESSCIDFTSGQWAGKTRCFTFYYNSSGTAVTSCSATFDGQACARCTVCGSDASGITWATLDCSNTSAGTDMELTCDDLEDPGAVRCAASTIGVTSLMAATATLLVLFSVV